MSVFYAELEANNDRAWWLAHKDVYAAGDQVVYVRRQPDGHGDDHRDHGSELPDEL